MSTLRVILIGGTSHTGKSTLGAFLAKRLGWELCATDRLARHPGRPWRTKPETVPSHVAEHYRSLSINELLDDVLDHYRRFWPTIEALVTRHATDRSCSPLVVEGSALWPDSIARLKHEGVGAIWLAASDSLLQTRIYRTSQFAEATGEEQLLIQKFLERTQLYNDYMLQAVARLRLVSVNVEAEPSLEVLSDLCLKRLQG